MVMKAIMGMMPQLNLITMRRAMRGSKSSALGWLPDVRSGPVVWGWLFAHVQDRLPRITLTLRGISFGIAAWLVMMIAAMPMAGADVFGLHDEDPHMKPYRAMLLAAASLVAASTPSQAAVEYPFSAARLNAEISRHHPVLIDITASWCPVCKVQAAAIQTALMNNPAFHNYVVLDVDFDSQKSVVRQLRATSQSTLIFIRHGHEIARLVGVTDKRKICAMMQRAET
jgi:thiol:disulfide interchange protein